MLRSRSTLSAWCSTELSTLQSAEALPTTRRADYAVAVVLVAIVTILVVILIVRIIVTTHAAVA